MSVGYVSPEAALGSPLAIVEEGDEIAIDIPNRRMDLLVDEKTVQARLKKFHWTFPKGVYPRYLEFFAKNVSSMAKGGIWDDE